MPILYNTNTLRLWENNSYDLKIYFEGGAKCELFPNKTTACMSSVATIQHDDGRHEVKTILYVNTLTNNVDISVVPKELGQEHTKFSITLTPDTAITLRDYIKAFSETTLRLAGNFTYGIS